MTAIESIEYHLSQAFIELDKLKKESGKVKKVKVDSGMIAVQGYIKRSQLKQKK